MPFLVEEWRLAKHHLVDEDANSPPVHVAVVAVPPKNLWRLVFKCAAASKGDLLIL